MQTKPGTLVKPGKKKNVYLSVKFVTCFFKHGLVMIEAETYLSVLDFVLGGLFILFTYHVFRFFSNKISAYLFYGLYAFFSFLAYLSMSEGGFIKAVSNYLGLNSLTKAYFTLLYNYAYFFFFATFLELKSINRKYYHLIIYPIYAALVLSTLLFLLASFGHQKLFYIFDDVFIVLIIYQAVYSYYLLLKIDNDLKWYIIIGGLSLFFTSLIGAGPVRELLGISIKMGDAIFFVGLLLENTLFSVALGQKWKRQILDRQKTDQELIAQLKRNEVLKEKINRQREATLSLENERIRIENENTDLALAALRSQINPHFIYNALNSIKSYILFNDKDSAVEYLNKFSRLVRLILNASFEKESSLLTETEVTKLYVEIENIRFDGEISFSINVVDDLDLREIEVPPLMLQPFVENAIWHGIAGSPEKKIEISISRSGEEVLIEIRDSGVGFKNNVSTEKKLLKSKKSYGIRIAAQMLSKFYEYHNISYMDNAERDPTSSGTTVQISIPAHRKNSKADSAENPD